MGQAALYSCLLHAFVILMAWVGLPHLKAPEKPLSQPIPIEIVTVGPETQAPKPMPVAEKAKPDKPKPVEKKPEEKKPDLVKPVPPTPEPVVEPPLPTPTPEPKPDPLPEPVKEPTPEPIKEPIKEPDPTPVPSPKPAPEAPAPKPSPPKPKPPAAPKAKEKPKEKPKDPPPQENFESILKNIEKMEQKSQDETDKSKTDTGAKAAHVGKESSELTISEMDKLRTHFKDCWSLPAGAQNAESLSVQIKITSSPDGMVQDAQVVEKGRMVSDPYYRIAAESALRAARDPQCAKLPLSLDKYEVWKVMTLNFDPRFLLGG